MDGDELGTPVVLHTFGADYRGTHRGIEGMCLDADGNTTAATLPLLYHDLRGQDRIRPGALLAFTAFGAGAHWGALVYRVPRAS